MKKSKDKMTECNDKSLYVSNKNSTWHKIGSPYICIKKYMNEVVLVFLKIRKQIYMLGLTTVKKKRGLLLR